VNYLVWLIRAKRWARRPPSARQVALVFGVIAASLAIYGLEQVFGWPDWLTPNRISAKP
jgi:hypothetical protein